MHIVLKGKDGFQKEEERDFPYDSPDFRFRIRQYPEIYQYFISPELRLIDREFRLKANFYALGKQIAYYEEI